MARRRLPLLLLLASAAAFAQQPASPPVAQPAPATDNPSPSAQDLLLDVERNQKASEAANKDYTYHVHLEQQELDRSGKIKKTTTIDSESLTIDGIRVDRTVARDGKLLSPKDVQKESDRLDKEAAKIGR